MVKDRFSVLSAAWAKRCAMIAEGRKLYAEGDKMYRDGSLKQAETEIDYFWVEGCKLYTEGESLWDSTVAKVLGSQNSQQIWLCDNTICLLTDGSMWTEVPE